MCQLADNWKATAANVLHFLTCPLIRQREIAFCSDHKVCECFVCNRKSSSGLWTYSSDSCFCEVLSAQEDANTNRSVRDWAHLSVDSELLEFYSSRLSSENMSAGKGGACNGCSNLLDFNKTAKIRKVSWTVVCWNNVFHLTIIVHSFNLTKWSLEDQS